MKKIIFPIILIVLLVFSSGCVGDQSSDDTAAANTSTNTGDASASNNTTASPYSLIDCTTIDVGDKFQEVFGSSMYAYYKDNCRNVNSNGWTETNNKVGCDLDGKGTIECASDAYMKLVEAFCA